MITTLKIAELTGLLISSAREKGFTYEMHTDFAETMAICAAMGKPYNTRLIDPLFHDFTKANCFWLLVRYADEVVACIGLRMDIFTKGEFVGFLDRQYARIYFSNRANAIEKSIFPPVFNDIEGPTVYLGDLYVKPEFRSGKKGFDLGQMILLGQSAALSEWDFQWLYAFIREEHADKGYGALYRAAFQYPASITWLRKPELRNDADWIVGSRKVDMHFLIEVELRRLRQSLLKSSQ